MKAILALAFYDAYFDKPVFPVRNGWEVKSMRSRS
jgi:hypothetical protein